MEEPRPPQGPMRSYLNCPYFTRPAAGSPMNNITGTVQGQNTLPPFFPATFQRRGLPNHTNIPPYMPATNPQFPQMYEFRNSFQGTFNAQRARPTLRQNGTQAPVQTGAVPGNMARHDGSEGFNPTGTTTMSSQAPSNPTAFARPPLFPSGLNSPSRHEHVYQTSGVTSGVPFHQATAGPQSNFGTITNNNPTAARALPSPYGMTNMNPSTQEGLFTINSTVQYQPAHRQLPALFPASNDATNDSNNTGNYNGHLPAPASQIQIRARRWDGPMRTRAQPRPHGSSIPPASSNHPGPANFYPPTSYAGMLREPDAAERLREHMTGNADTPPIGPTGDHPDLLAGLAEHANNNPRVSAFYDYIGSRHFQQRVSESYANGGLTEPGRPGRDFDEFLAHLRRSVAAGDYHNVEQRIRAATAAAGTLDRTESGPAGPAAPQSTGEPEWTTREMRTRQHDLTVLMQRAREMSHAGFTINAATAAREMHSRRATTRAISELVKVDITTLEKEDRSCSICMEPFGEPEPVQGKIEWPVKMPCGHVFGLTCIKTWLSEHCTCPSCRRKVESEFMRSSPSSTDFGTTMGRDRNVGEDNDSDEPTRRVARRRRPNGPMQIGGYIPQPRQPDITAVSAARTPERLGPRHASRAHDGVRHRPLGPSGLSRGWIPSPEPAGSEAGEINTRTNSNTGTRAPTVAAVENIHLSANLASRTDRPDWLPRGTFERGNVRSNQPAPTTASMASGTITGNGGSPRRARRPVRTRGGPSAGNNNSSNRTAPRFTLFRIDPTIPESPTRSRRENENGSNLTSNTSPNNNNNNTTTTTTTTIRRPRSVRVDVEALRRIGEELDALTHPGPLNDTLDTNMASPDEPLMTFSDDEEGGEIE